MEFLSGSDHREAIIDYQTHSVQVEPMPRAGWERRPSGGRRTLGKGEGLPLATPPSSDLRPTPVAAGLPGLQLRWGLELTGSGFPFLTPRE